MFEVGGFGGSEAISLETGKSGKTDKRMYLTSEYISMTKELTVTWDKQGNVSFLFSSLSVLTRGHLQRALDWLVMRTFSVKGL